MKNRGEALENEYACLDTSEEARIIASIVGRAAAFEFPLTCPAEQRSLTIADAEEVLRLVQKHDHVGITSYNEAQSNVRMHVRG